MRRTASALAVEPDEVPVISNELLEAHVVSIRTDLTDLKTEVRAVAAKAESEIKTAVARMDEQFREVRQDIRELRADNKTLRDKIDENYAFPRQEDRGDTGVPGSTKIDGNYASLDKKIECVHMRPCRQRSTGTTPRYEQEDRCDDMILSAKIDGNYTSLDKKIGEAVHELQ